MNELCLFSAGECPICAASGAILFVKSVSSGRIFFLCPVCGVAWHDCPGPFTVNSVQAPTDIAPYGIELPNKNDLEQAQLHHLIKEEVSYERFRDLLSVLRVKTA
jgi:hypothetical protein